jgi:hypothetical protein
MTNDDLHLLLEDFRSEVSPPDEVTAQRIYRLATSGGLRGRSASTARVPHPLLRLPQLSRRRRLIALSAAAAAGLSLAGVLVALTLSAAAPASAYAAAKKAIAASSAGAVDSGTLTLTSTGPYSGGPWRGASVVTAVRWNGDDLAITSGDAADVVPGFVQLLEVGGGVYLQRADGSWLHYASDADIGRPFYAGAVQVARGLAAGSRAAQIIASTYGLQKTVEPDGSTVFSGTIPPSNPAEGVSTDDTTQIMLPSFGPGGAFQLVVGNDGLVRQMSETASPPLTGAWSIGYSQLGSTPPISPPSAYTEGTVGDLPTPPQEVAPAESGSCPATATAPPETGPVTPAETGPCPGP